MGLNFPEDIQIEFPENLKKNCELQYLQRLTDGKGIFT